MDHKWHAEADLEDRRRRDALATGVAETRDGLLVVWGDDVNGIEREWMGEILGVDPRRIVFMNEGDGSGAEGMAGGGGYVIMNEAWVEEVEADLREQGRIG